MNALSPAEAYRLWAPAYDSETAISFLENELVDSLTPPLDGLRLLDVGCGTGRRLAGIGAAEAIGVDLCPEMLSEGALALKRQTSVRLVQADMRQLPLTDFSIDVVWCRLAIGHVADPHPVYREIARVARRGAHVIVSDFHPEAYARGHRRTFRSSGDVHEVEHHVHSPAVHLTAALEWGLIPTALKEGMIGQRVRHFYEERDRIDLYERDIGLPVVLVLAFRRSACAGC